MREKEENNNVECPVAYALDMIGGKWHLQIIWALYKQPIQRYSELKRGVKGITDIMLSQTLKELEGYGLVTRTQYLEVPPRVEYSLTEEGKTLKPIINELSRWGLKRMDAQKEW